MKVQFNYSFTLSFEEAIKNHAFCLRIVPTTNAVQTLMNWHLHINDKHDFNHGMDGFGNQLIFGAFKEPHREFRVHIDGEVQLGEYCYQDNEEPKLYLHPSALIPFSSLTYAFLEDLILPELSFEKAIFLNTLIYERFEYLQGVSTPTCDTDALLLGKQGVCQDFSHLLIALLRLNDIPSRYVNGFIDGEGETHAWVEAHIDGFWRGFDPTHGRVLALDPYIKIAHGRDFFDCRLNRGVFQGRGYQSMNVSVRVTKDEQ